MGYLPTLSEKIIQLLKDGIGQPYGIVQYFDGDPLEIPLHYLPCIVVEKQDGDLTQTSTQRDDLTSTIIVKVVLNKEDDFGVSDDVDQTQKKLERIIEARDDVTGQYLPNSISGVLRQKFSMDNRVTNQKAKVRYGLNANRPTGLTAEAQITLTIDERIQLANVRT